MACLRVWWLLILAASGFSIVTSSNKVGCLFNEDLCRPDGEWCYDDGAFGRCLSKQIELNEGDIYRHNLGREELSLLEREIEELLTQGYKWSHDRTQCILQAILYAFQTGAEFEKIICDDVKEPQLEHLTVKDIDQGRELEMDPRNMAYIRYTPSEANPHADFADEVYYPPDGSPVIPPSPEQPDFAVVRRSLPGSRHFSTQYNTPEGFRSGLETRDQTVFLQESLADDIFNEVQPKDLVLGLNSPERFNEEYETKFIPDGINKQSGRGDGISREEGVRKALNNLANKILLDEGEGEIENGRGYTEGGTVFIPESLPHNKAYADLLDDLGFKRKERLDVKKPGPPFNTKSQEATKEVAKPQKKEVERHADTNPDSEQYDIVDTTFAYIEFKDSIQTWKKGSLIINTVAKLLNVSRSLFTHERVDRNEVTFKVEEPNSVGLNASEVARKIKDIKEDLRREIGVVVTSSGIGDQAKVPVQVRLTGDSEMYVAIVIVCGVLAALVLSAFVLILTRRHASSKLQGLATADTEPSKHYQDLCRARMSSKSQPEPSNVAAPPQRITSLSRESDNSPSSRSSTSSWSEEPALSNMDISTGHMVLAYMEDHLRNKDRLETEWTALCAYEADPCATTIAQRTENEKKNRYPGAVPYDHARVVLNELSNITSSDYINASTITDHDPRNPAYIVTQGPLPHTAPDLWQMVWEQGCVVLVMLTRLVENDVALCHRYWPEEGSELYHIYEVHLVSEHIWCDDYLVRSFYLKNLKTGETRTVTQFHFLSWPEGGVPTATKALLEFRRKVNKSFRGRSCPIVVHCSDGVGRSGTYCLLDMVLNRMAKGAKEIDIAATLEHIRDQRAGAVATKQQFQLVLAAVAEEVQAILRVLPQQ